MMRLETPFVTVGDLIIVEGHVIGPRGTTTGRFVLDTGAIFTTVTPELVDLIGYSARDAFKRTRVRTAISDESGYALRVAELTVLRFTIPSLLVNVFDLGFDDIDGLLGLNFLNDFNYEIRSADRRIVFEKIA